jgi:hypothetical protein
VISETAAELQLFDFRLRQPYSFLVLGMRIKEKRKRLIQVEHIVLIDMKFKLYVKY